MAALPPEVIDLLSDSSESGSDIEEIDQDVYRSGVLTAPEDIRHFGQDRSQEIDCFIADGVSSAVSRMEGPVGRKRRRAVDDLAVKGCDDLHWQDATKRRRVTVV